MDAEDGGFLWEWWASLGPTGQLEWQAWIGIGFAVVWVVGIYLYLEIKDWRARK